MSGGLCNHQAGITCAMNQARFLWMISHMREDSPERVSAFLQDASIH